MIFQDLDFVNFTIEMFQTANNTWAFFGHSEMMVLENVWNSLENPCIVCCLKHVNGEVDKSKILKNHVNINQITAGELPSLVAPKDITDDRKNYPYNDIRPFCKIGTENEVAPPPST